MDVIKEMAWVWVNEKELSAVQFSDQLTGVFGGLGLLVCAMLWPGSPSKAGLASLL